MASWWHHFLPAVALWTISSFITSVWTVSGRTWWVGGASSVRYRITLDYWCRTGFSQEKWQDWRVWRRIKLWGQGCQTWSELYVDFLLQIYCGQMKSELLSVQYFNHAPPSVCFNALVYQCVAPFRPSQRVRGVLDSKGGGAKCGAMPCPPK